MQDYNRAIKRMLFKEMVKIFLGDLLGYLLLLAEMAGVAWLLWNFLFTKLITTLPYLPFYGMVVIAISNIVAVFVATEIIKKIKATVRHGA